MPPNVTSCTSALISLPRGSLTVHNLQLVHQLCGDAVMVCVVVAVSAHTSSCYYVSCPVYCHRSAGSLNTRPAALQDSQPRYEVVIAGEGIVHSVGTWWWSVCHAVHTH